MFVINKKRIIFLTLAIFLPIGMFVLQTAGNINTNKTVETMATPVSSKTIIIDAGHGGEDGGAVSNNGISEAKINLKIALKLQQLLEQSGSNVVLTRSDNNAIYDIDKKTLREKKNSDIRNRVKIGNNSSADIFVSIHLNKIPENQYYGWQTLQNNLNETIQKENKRTPLKINNVYIIKHVEIPTVIVECGFLSNHEEEKQLQQAEYQTKLAWGIYNGIMEYF